MRKRWRSGRWTSLIVLATACGGNAVERADRGPGAAFAMAPAAAPAELPGAGRLVGATFLNRISAAEIAQAIDGAGTRAPAARPVYAVDNHRLTYRTLDGSGRAITASGLVSIPVKAPGAPSPVLSYQHGTLFMDAQAPSNHAVIARPLPSSVR